MLSLLFLSRLPPPPAIYTLSLHDALPICASPRRVPAPGRSARRRPRAAAPAQPHTGARRRECGPSAGRRSEEHTSELQSRVDLVCRLLLEKKKNKQKRDVKTHILSSSESD